MAVIALVAVVLMIMLTTIFWPAEPCHTVRLGHMLIAGSETCP